MFHDLIIDPTNPVSREALVTAAGATTWGSLAERCRAFAASHRKLAGRRVGVRFRPVAESFAALAALDGLEADVFLLDARHSSDDLADTVRRFHLGSLVLPDPASPDGAEVRDLEGGEAGSGESTVTILTSGTTGPPKAARHTWAGLARPTRRGARESHERWLLTYRPQLYAGLQVILQCWVNRGTLIVPDSAASVSDVVELMRDARVQYASATPSYWRRMLLLAEPARLAKLALRQITLGGEQVDQNVLDGLRSRIPGARLVHIYATTELGRCFSVTDGRAGFPARFLDKASPDDVELRVVDGELQVRSANAMETYDPHSGLDWTGDEWFPTADLVEIRGDRVYFVGRTSDIINVGGNKVHPAEVEEVIREVPGVADVLVYKKKSSLAGELVACDVVAEEGQDRNTLRKTLVAHCAAALAAHQRPRLVQFVDEISLFDTGKKSRGAR